MGRTEPADKIRDDFIARLQSEGAVVEDMASLALIYDNNIFKPIFTRWANLQREIFLIKQVGFINIHVRSEPPGFWGITKQVIRDFEAIKKELQVPCRFVLLVGIANSSEVNGYILEDISSSPIIHPASEQEKAFKINEHILDGEKTLKGSENIAKQLINLGMKKGKETEKVLHRKNQK